MARVNRIGRAQVVLPIYQELAPDLQPAVIDSNRSGGELTAGQPGIRRGSRNGMARCEPGWPAYLRAQLANSLANFSACLLLTDRPDQALAVAEEALEVERVLLLAVPTMPRGSLARALLGVGNCLTSLERAEDALGPLGEAVSILRQAAVAEPLMFNPGLAVSLYRVATCLRDVASLDEAIAVAQEAAGIQRQLLSNGRPSISRGLALTLTTLLSCLALAGHDQEADEAASEASLHESLWRKAQVAPAGVGPYSPLANAFPPRAGVPGPTNVEELILGLNSMGTDN
jgi:tetratricopeptide (TPR) repeat protein